IPHRIEYNEDMDAFILYDCELLECSLVGIGSQRDALVGDKAGKPQATKDAPSSEDDVRDSLINTREVLDKLVEADNTLKVRSHFKARDLVRKAIRALE